MSQDSQLATTISEPSPTSHRRNSFVEKLLGVQSPFGTIQQPITTPRRRLSLNTGGPSALPGTQQGLFRNRASSGASAVSESPFENDDDSSPPTTATSPSSPFSRRMSFGRPLERTSPNTSPILNQEGFNAGDNMLNRAKRGSFSFGVFNLLPQNPPAAMQSPTVPPVNNVVPAPRPVQKDPVMDPLAERMLRNDFYMD